MSRPTFIDLRSNSSEGMNTIGFPSPRAAPSPRMQHLAGDVPPAMSPLDMFAAQSRLLAKQLEDSKSNGRRVSRLPPLTTTDHFTKPKPTYNRSPQNDAKEVGPTRSPRPRDDETSGTLPGVEEPQFRPKSCYTRMSTVPPVWDDEDQEVPITFSPEDQPFVTPAEFQTVTTSPKDYFSAPFTMRQQSPPIPKTTETMSKSSIQSLRNPKTFIPSNEPERGLSIESTSSKSFNCSLAPPKSPLNRQAASIRSIPQDSSDEENSASTHGSGFSHNRKLSSSSGISMPSSPLPPFAQTHGRSPSLNSEYSIGGSRQARPAFNFSRPLSRDSRPSMEAGSRQPSFDSRPSIDASSIDAIRPHFASMSRQPSSDSQRFFLPNDTVQTPVSFDQEQLPDFRDPHAPAAPSYIYAKYSLPRGRILSRDRKDVEDTEVAVFEWEQPHMQSNVRPSTPPLNRGLALSPSPGRSPRPSMDLHCPSPRPSLEHRSRGSPRPSAEQRFRLSPKPSLDERPISAPRPSIDHIPKVTFRPSEESTRSNHPRPPPTPVTNDDQSEYTASTRSGSTIKASRQQPALSMDFTAEDHLAKGIALHEKGNLQESTYHLRIAAKQNLPTAMLLYALACRHGWGMRKSPQEGVQWLRKAADFASLEIAIDEDADAKPGDILERKTRRAQFALSIYELGMSHAHGWGMEVDKALALRCFEIAGNWGDADALAEAGFCYTQGQGCKKDLKKAAKLYRMAEKKGISMVGNSWIYKPKYADDDAVSTNSNERGRDAGKPSTPEKKPRDKSRTRTIFGRKKSISKH